MVIGCTDGMRTLRFVHDLRCKSSIVKCYVLFVDKLAAVRVRRILDLKNVTQCAALEDYGILLVLSNKACLNAFQSTVTF